MNSEQVCAFADCSYRQLDYWVRKGWIPGVQHLRSTGSGYPRDWRHQEAVYVRMLARLINSGLKADVAADVLATELAKGTRVNDMTAFTLPGGAALVLQPRLESVSA